MDNHYFLQPRRSAWLYPPSLTQLVAISGALRVPSNQTPAGRIHLKTNMNINMNININIHSNSNINVNINSNKNINEY